MGTPVQRSIRLMGKNALTLDRSSGESGEIFLDNTTNTLRIFTGKHLGGYPIATQQWVDSHLSTFNGNINTSGDVVAGKLVGDLYASNKTSKVLESGTNGTDASFTGNVTGNLTGNVTGNVTGNLTGNVTGNLTGNADTVTNGLYSTGSYTNPNWLVSINGNKITGAVSLATAVTNGVYTTDTGTVTNNMLAGNIANNKLSNSSLTVGTTPISLGGSSTTLAGLTSVSSTSFTGSLTGNASTATKLAATKNINGVAFDGSADITVTASSNTLTGTTLKSTVVNSSLTSVGTLTDLSVAGAVSVNNSITATGDITTNANIVVSNLPTSTTHATNKKYVDTRALAMSIAMA